MSNQFTPNTLTHQLKNSLIESGINIRSEKLKTHLAHALGFNTFNGWVAKPFGIIINNTVYEKLNKSITDIHHGQEVSKVAFTNWAFEVRDDVEKYLYREAQGSLEKIAHLPHIYLSNENGFTRQTQGLNFLSFSKANIDYVIKREKIKNSREHGHVTIDLEMKTYDFWLDHEAVGEPYYYLNHEDSNTPLAMLTALNHVTKKNWCTVYMITEWLSAWSQVNNTPLK